MSPVAYYDPLSEPPPRADVAMRRVVRNAAHIARMRLLTHDTYEIVVVCAPGSAPLQGFAGQFATLEVAGVRHPRPYSFARDPHAERPGEHTFHIRLVPGGAMSAWLAAGDRTGAAVEIAGPLGGFALDDSALPMLVIAGGSGMSAVKALLEAACRRQQPRACFFLYGARTQVDLHSTEEIAQLASRWCRTHRFQFVPVLSEEPSASGWTGARGLVTEHLRSHYLERSVLQPGQLRAWLCGPPPMVEAGRNLLLAAGVPDSRVLCDIFTDARSPAPSIDNSRCMLCDECLLVRPVADCIVETASVEVAPDGTLRGYSPIAPTRTAGLYYHSLLVDPARCIRCHACVHACPHDAITAGMDAPA